MYFRSVFWFSPEKRDAGDGDERRARRGDGDVRARRAAPHDPARALKLLARAIGPPPLRARRVRSEPHRAAERPFRAGAPPRRRASSARAREGARDASGRSRRNTRRARAPKSSGFDHEVVRNVSNPLHLSADDDDDEAAGRSAWLGAPNATPSRTSRASFRRASRAPRRRARSARARRRG